MCVTFTAAIGSCHTCAEFIIVNYFLELILAAVSYAGVVIYEQTHVDVEDYIIMKFAVAKRLDALIEVNV